tara:strand:+ start:2800 stop:3231 length:432 start_codon:yes stop_codon:yes gene_type:complete
MSNNLENNYYNFFTDKVKSNITQKLLLLQKLFPCKYIQNEISSYLFVPFVGWYRIREDVYNKQKYLVAIKNSLYTSCNDGSFEWSTNYTYEYWTRDYWDVEVGLLNRLNKRNMSIWYFDIYCKKCGESILGLGCDCTKHSNEK